MRYIIEIDDTNITAKKALSIVKELAKETTAITFMSDEEAAQRYDDWFINSCEKAKQSGVVDTDAFLKDLGT